MSISSAQAIARQDEAILQLRRSLFLGLPSGPPPAVPASPATTTAGASAPSSPRLRPRTGRDRAQSESRPVSAYALSEAALAPSGLPGWASPTSTFIEVDDDFSARSVVAAAAAAADAHGMRPSMDSLRSAHHAPHAAAVVAHSRAASRLPSRNPSPEDSPALRPSTTIDVDLEVEDEDGLPPPLRRSLTAQRVRGSAESSFDESIDDAASHHHVQLPPMTPEEAAAAAAAEAYGVSLPPGMLVRNRGTSSRAASFAPAIPAYFDVKRHFLVTLAEALIKFGSPTYRMEYLLHVTAATLKVSISVSMLPNLLLMTYENPTDRSKEAIVLTVKQGYDLDKLFKSNLLCKSLASKDLTIEDAVEDLEDLIDAPATWSGPAYVTACVGCSAFIAPLAFNGSLIDAGIAGLLGSIVAMLELASGRVESLSYVFEILAATLVSILAAMFKLLIEVPMHVSMAELMAGTPADTLTVKSVAAAASAPGLCYTGVTLSTLFVILPGLSIATSFVEINSLNVISGTVRLAVGLVKTLTQAFGIILGSRVALTAANTWWPSESAAVFQDNLFAPCPAATSMAANSSVWLFLPMLFVFAIAQGVQLRASPAQFGIITVAVFTAFWASRALSGLNIGAEPTAAVTAFLVGVVGNVYSRISHNPGIAPILAGVLLLVPGGLGVRTSLSLIAAFPTDKPTSAFGNGSSATSASGSLMLQMMLIALCIALGVLCSRIVPPVETQLKTSRIVELRRKIARREAAAGRAERASAFSGEIKSMSPVVYLRRSVRRLREWVETSVDRVRESPDAKPSSKKPVSARATGQPVVASPRRSWDLESESSASVPPTPPLPLLPLSVGVAVDIELGTPPPTPGALPSPDLATPPVDASPEEVQKYHQKLRHWLRRWETQINSGRTGTAERSKVKKWLVRPCATLAAVALAAIALLSPTPVVAQRAAGDLSTAAAECLKYLGASATFCTPQAAPAYNCQACVAPFACIPTTSCPRLPSSANVDNLFLLAGKPTEASCYLQRVDSCQGQRSCVVCDPPCQLALLSNGVCGVGNVTTSFTNATATASSRSAAVATLPPATNTPTASTLPPAAPSATPERDVPLFERYMWPIVVGGSIVAFAIIISATMCVLRRRSASTNAGAGHGGKGAQFEQRGRSPAPPPPFLRSARQGGGGGTTGSAGSRRGTAVGSEGVLLTRPYSRSASRQSSSRASHFQLMQDVATGGDAADERTSAEMLRKLHAATAAAAASSSSPAVNPHDPFQTPPAVAAEPADATLGGHLFTVTHGASDGTGVPRRVPPGRASSSNNACSSRSIDISIETVEESNPYAAAGAFHVGANVPAIPRMTPAAAAAAVATREPALTHFEAELLSEAFRANLIDEPAEAPAAARTGPSAAATRGAAAPPPQQQIREYPGRRLLDVHPDQLASQLYSPPILTGLPLI
ncbi:pheromone-regulated protein prm10 [Blastocladiella emersonii ATCC 22665]|nr:pheromone-regulated protein prm10 [Blastocladiella emersonii ATCC 22665]